MALALPTIATMVPWRRRAVSSALFIVLLAGCASQPVSVPRNVDVGPALPAAWPSPREASNDAAPAILAAHFSSLDVRRGERWSGAFITTTNVASVEVRSNLFSIVVPRTTYGSFAFDLDVFETPPIFVRPYTVRVIARNTAGEEAEEDVPFRIR